MTRDLNDLIPEMVPLAQEGIYQCQARGLLIIVTSVARHYKEQFALYAQGRNPISVVNGYRKLAGLYPLRSEAENYIVTWTMKSKHLINIDDSDVMNDKSRAFDFAIMSAGKVHYNVKEDFNKDKDKIPDYVEAGIIFESLGLEWGGRWPEKQRDYPHVQWRG
jgi:peptidoglycan L-alanyl-D-glutamate endopeptidase CwlK